jgi:hypothetical protein
MKKLSKKQIVLLVVVLLLIITNPSLSAFKAYAGHREYPNFSRPVNLFIFSIYDDSGDKYVGIFGNFIELPNGGSNYTTAPDSIKTDSSKNDPFKEFGGHKTN